MLFHFHSWSNAMNRPAPNSDREDALADDPRAAQRTTTSGARRRRRNRRRARRRLHRGRCRRARASAAAPGRRRRLATEQRLARRAQVRRQLVDVVLGVRPGRRGQSRVRVRLRSETASTASSSSTSTGSGLICSAPTPERRCSDVVHARSAGVAAGSEKSAVGVGIALLEVGGVVGFRVGVSRRRVGLSSTVDSADSVAGQRPGVVVRGRLVELRRNGRIGSAASGAVRGRRWGSRRSVRRR